MTEKKDVIDLFLLELIGIHLKKSNAGGDKKKDLQLIQNAESIINALSEEDRDTVKQYVNNLISHMADEELCLYTAGIKDGIKLLNWVTEICMEDA